MNEEGNVKNLIQRTDTALRNAGLDYELIFIDDHSTDKTVRIVEDLSNSYPVSCHLKEGNRGKAFSLLEGFKYGKYELFGILDADLQYPPEAIPEMVEKIYSDQADLVVVRRNEENLSIVRKILSKGFNFFFAYILHGLKFDVQAGQKVFKRQIAEEISISPTRWTFDMEFLIKARQAGYRIDEVGIAFADREVGESKINILSSITEIGLNAIKLRFKKSEPIIISPKGPNMIGSGVALNGQRFITHTNLDWRISAFQTFTLWQKFFILGSFLILGLGVYFNALNTAIVFMGILSSIYFADALFNLFLVLRSLNNPPELRFTRKQISQLEDKYLPIYSVLVPLFREGKVLPGFIKAIDRVDWPKDKLDVMLLLEEKDPETIAVARSMDLPDYIRIIIVPNSQPKTKPKACNYGLSIAKGEYLVIYDAEDQPEPSQLKKAYLGFKNLPESVKCIQAKLNYFNPNQNMLTRMFTAEYSLWFDIVLPGLQSINTVIPLGGTSNHFRTKDLVELRGWDPFNVTEDCDLGVRLFKMGYTTAIVDSVTLEEANSNLKNWIRQRSRWIKGYMQTFLVHMRNPIKFAKDSGWHALYFQMNVGGKIAFILINPILWLATISYFALRAIVGPYIEAIYPGPVLYMAATSLIFGNFVYFYYYMIGCAKRGHWQLIKFIFLIPFYWFFMSVAAVMALYELIVRPHYWQKTNHGLHLSPAVLPKGQAEAEPKIVTEKEIEVEPVIPTPVLEPVQIIQAEITPRGKVPEVKEIKDKKSSLVFSRGGILIMAMMVSNFLNFGFNAFLGRVMSLDDLGLVTLVNTLWYVASIFIGGVSSTINHRTAYISAKDGVNASIHFWKVTLRLAVIIALVLSSLWLIAIPFLSEFFNIADRTVLLLFTPAMTLGMIAAANRGFLQGNLMFQSTAVIFVVEALSKLITALILVHYGQNGWVFLSIPISIFASALMATVLSSRIATHPSDLVNKVGKYEFPKFFYAASIMSSISSAIFLSLDIILVKHYLTPIGAGEYSLLSLVGKMIYFLGSLPAVFMITFVSRAEGLGKNPRSTFNIIFAITFAMVSLGFVTLGIFGDSFVPVLLGPKTLSILNDLFLYTLAISLFTLSNVIVSYHLARSQYIFPVTSLIFSGLMAMGIILYHDSIASIVSVILAVSLGSLFSMLVMHIYESSLKFVSNNVLDFFDAFINKPIIPRLADGKRVLILNWRDTRHVFSGGAEVYVQELAKRMVSKGDYVTVFSGNDGKSPRNEVIDGVNIIRRGGFYFVYPWAFVYYFTQFRGQYDIIIDCHNGIPFFTPLYVKEPVICVVHHIHQEIFKRLLPLPLAIFARFLERDVMPYVYKNINFVTVSESSKEEMIHYGMVGKGIEIVYNGVELKDFKPAQKSEVPMILYLGRLKAYKSIDVLITAFKILMDQAPDAFLVIAGSGEEEKHLKRLAEQLGTLDRIIFVGKVSEADKIDLLQKAWVMVNPSFMEGWGITTIEANACGTPVIAADVPGLRDSVKDFETGYLVSHGDTNGFAKRIISVIEDFKLRNKLSEKSIQWAQNFTWDKSVIKLSSIVSRNK